jgi:pSer/pThr/pTyr-binding forkhead associated (FHA) protein
VITCPKCTKENQDHYKFCLGCGAELPRDAAPKKFAPGTPPQGVQARAAVFADESTNVGPGPGRQAARPSPAGPPAPAPAMAVGPAPPAAPAPVPPPGVAAAQFAPAGQAGTAIMQSPVVAPPAAPAAGGSIACPQCEHPNPSNNKFCASCGFKLPKPAESIPAPPPAAPVPTSGAVLTALRADGTEAGTYALPVGTVTIGRDTGAIFAGDSYLSPRHATFTPRAGRLMVRDESSLNGVYRKLRRDEPVALNPGDVFRIGQEIVRFELLTPMQATADGVERLGSPSKGYIGRIAMVIGRDASGNAYPVPETGLHLGRERGDVLFPEDGYVSGLHCRLASTNGQLYLTDLGSSNGTFVRLGGEAEVTNGDVLLMGQQLFRISL